jgi:hypothetical protein
MGDFIDAQGYTGTVKKSTFSTMLNTDKKLVIPNGHSLRTHLIILLKLAKSRWKFGIAYGDDGEFQRAINDFIARQPNFKRPVTLLVS